jgi:hypothetical protein
MVASLIAGVAAGCCTVNDWAVEGYSCFGETSRGEQAAAPSE